MIQLPKDIAAKDVQQWLSGGWFYADRGNGPEVGRLGRISPTGNSTEVLFDEGPKVLPFDKLYAEWPMCGALNILPTSLGKGLVAPGKFAVSLTRLQKKQWKRTYNVECLRLRVISTSDEHFGITADSKSCVMAAFNPEYYTYTQAVKFKFPDGWTSVAINPSLIVMKVPTQTMVFVDGEVIGVIPDGTNQFTCVNPGLKRRLLPHLDYAVE